MVRWGDINAIKAFARIVSLNAIRIAKISYTSFAQLMKYFSLEEFLLFCLPEGSNLPPSRIFGKLNSPFGLLTIPTSCSYHGQTPYIATPAILPLFDVPCYTLTGMNRSSFLSSRRTLSPLQNERSVFSK